MQRSEWITVSVKRECGDQTGQLCDYLGVLFEKSLREMTALPTVLLDLD